MNTEMLEAVDREQVSEVVENWRSQGQDVALVPTMGNLHEGHLSLVREARKHANRVVTSIYVNPTQFGAGEDYSTYPRTYEADRSALKACGCDLLFMPGHETVYPFGTEHPVRVTAPADMASRLEGESRPGHFDGVLTVVARLFNLVSPDVAVFGEKDYQQLLLIRRMVDDLSFDIRVVAVPTVREHSGLAMSSRNSYLDETEKNSAAQLNLVISRVAERVRHDPDGWKQAESDAVAKLERLGFQVDYVAVRDARSLAKPSGEAGGLRVLVAAKCGQTRLIDNMEIT